MLDENLTGARPGAVLRSSTYEKVNWRGYDVYPF
mgnify:CR=1 FL=1